MTIKMRGLFSMTLVLLVVLMVTVEAGHKHGDKKGQKAKEGGEAECTEKFFAKCVPNAGDCGDGFREATCGEHTTKHKCNIACNWKKAFGADCKYRFTNWGECDTTTSTKSRSGTLKKSLFKLDCEATIKVTKPCSSKPKGKGGKGKREGELKREAD
ncbi:hypothetical protein J4Q44_G00118730 [Coregonus suidteri]|uniref:Midkine n=1 Tax=Coregonus suidteri TaxID=861788 RepID=A0AAN8M453_9TELE